MFYRVKSLLSLSTELRALCVLGREQLDIIKGFPTAASIAV